MFGLLMFCLSAGIQAQPNWTINYPSYQYTMTITGIIVLDYVDSSNPNDIIGAFVNDSCRGIAKPVLNSNRNRYYEDMVIYSNDYKTPIKFKIWSADKKATYEIERTVTFEINKIVGSVEHPWYWSTPALSSDAKFSSFNIAGQIGETKLTDSTVSLNFAADFLLNSIKPTFEVPKRAVVRVANTVQVSGETTNDFTDTVVYRVVAADETDSVDYKVIAIRDEKLHVDATNTITPNNDGVNDYWIVHNLEYFVGYSLTIFNSQGLQVYKTSDYQNNWNGVYQGNTLSSGVYHYMFKKGSDVHYGSISIIR